MLRMHTASADEHFQRRAAAGIAPRSSGQQNARCGAAGTVCVRYVHDARAQAGATHGSIRLCKSVYDELVQFLDQVV